MGLHCPFGHLKHKLWPKKGQELNWQFDSQPLKVWNRPNFLASRQRATYHWKAFNNSCNVFLDLIAIGGLHAKLCACKIVGVRVVGILGLPLGSLRVLGQKAIWMWPPWRGIEYTIRGKVVASPKSGP
jgi:hypothetical protein